MKTDGTAEIFKCISIETPLNFFANVDWPMLKFFMWGRNIWARKISILLKNKVAPMKFSPFCSLFRHTRLYGYLMWRFYIKIKAMLQQEKENSSKYQESRKLPQWASSMWTYALGIHWDSGFKIRRFMGGILALGELLTKLSVTS